MAEHNDLGKIGEELARKFLISNGYSIRASNWYFGKNEIDIIAEKENVLAIVEVKTRSSAFEAEAQSTVTKKKQKFLINAANFYLIKHKIEKEARFDIITIIVSNNKPDIEHIENAFYPTL